LGDTFRGGGNIAAKHCFPPTLSKREKEGKNEYGRAARLFKGRGKRKKRDLEGLSSGVRSHQKGRREKERRGTSPPFSSPKAKLGGKKKRRGDRSKSEISTKLLSFFLLYGDGLGGRREGRKKKKKTMELPTPALRKRRGERKQVGKRDLPSVRLLLDREGEKEGREWRRMVLVGGKERGANVGRRSFTNCLRGGGRRKRVWRLTLCG